VRGPGPILPQQFDTYDYNEANPVVVVVVVQCVQVVIDELLNCQVEARTEHQLIKLRKSTTTRLLHWKRFVLQVKIFWHSEIDKRTRKCGQCWHDMRPCFKIALSLTSDVVNLYSKFERCMVFSVFKLAVGMGQTDGRMRSKPSSVGRPAQPFLLSGSINE